MRLSQLLLVTVVAVDNIRGSEDSLRHAHWGSTVRLSSWWELIISFDKENYVPVMSGPTKLQVKNIPFNKSNAHISPASPDQSHALRLGAHHCTAAFIPVYETSKPSAAAPEYTLTYAPI